jgi:hypothetical protein
MPAIMDVPYVHDPDTNWLYIVGRVKPGTAMPPLQEKLSAVLRQTLLKTRINFTSIIEFIAALAALDGMTHSGMNNDTAGATSCVIHLPRLW